MKMNLRRTIENSRRCQKQYCLECCDKHGRSLFMVHAATGGSGHDSILGVESEQENLYLGAK
jgi:hypothetical protein